MARPTDWQAEVAQIKAAAPAPAGSGWINTGPTGSSEIGLQLQIKMYKARQQAAQARLKTLQSQAAGLKGKTDAKSKAALAVLNQQIKDTQARIATNGKRLTTAQNNYYKVTGQYDKLLSGDNRDAFMALQSLFNSYGLGSLSGKIYDYVKNGYSSDTISILLQDTPEYKARFAGNQARIKAGLPVLSPAEYLSTESAYQQIMSSAGLPPSFYDQPSDFATWIGENKSPSEIQARVDLASQATTLSSPAYRQALNQMGIDDAHLTAYYLDPTKALPLLQKQAATAQIGAEALKQGMAFDQSYAEQLATEGVSQQAAAQGYAQVAGELGTMQGLGSIYNQGWTQRESEQAALEGSAAATAKKAGLLSQERGAFGGQSGNARAGLGVSQAAR
jgi:hypothetical protein